MVATSPVSKKPSSSRISPALALEIGLRHREPCDFQSAEALAVPWQLAIFLVHDLHFDAERRPALLGLEREQFLVRQVLALRFDRAGRADRAHFGHAPGVADLDAVIVLERPDHRGRTRGTADQHFLQRRQALALLLHIGEQHQPDRRHGGRHRHLLAFEQLIDRSAVEPRARHHHFGAAHRARKRQRPRIGVEHRHDGQKGVRSRRSEGNRVRSRRSECSTFERCE